MSPRDGGPTWQFDLRPGRTRILLVGLAILVLGGGAGWLLLGTSVGPVVESHRLAAENDSLRQEVARVLQIQQSLREMEQMQQQLWSLAGVEARTQAYPSLGAGSPPTRRIDPANWSPGAPSRVPRQGPISRGYSDAHTGIDVAGAVGAPVAAAGDGVVTRVDVDADFGNLLVIDHGDSLETWYGHNSAVWVSSGDSVAAGQTVAEIGNTGRSSAPHLHFEVRKNGVPVDPGVYIREYQNRKAP